MIGYFSGIVKYYSFEHDFNLEKIEILDKKYPITYGFDSNLEQVLVQTVVINNAVVGFHVIAPFEVPVPTDNKANIIEILKAIDKAAVTLYCNRVDPDKKVFQAFEI